MAFNFWSAPAVERARDKIKTGREKTQQYLQNRPPIGPAQKYYKSPRGRQGEGGTQEVNRQTQQPQQQQQESTPNEQDRRDVSLWRKFFDRRNQNDVRGQNQEKQQLQQRQLHSHRRMKWRENSN